MRSFGALFAVIVVAASHWITASASGADAVFSNPFLTAGELRAQRDALPSATLRLRYEATTAFDDGTPEDAFDVVIDVAEDWAFVQDKRGKNLYDFRLFRVFRIDDASQSFVAFNQTGYVAFRVMERQNRVMIDRIAKLAGAEQITDDACDAETELGVALPLETGTQGDAEAVHSATSVTANCNGRQVGLAEFGAGPDAPAALWPTLASVFAMHPALSSEVPVRKSPPTHIETVFRQLGRVATLSIRLLSSETTDLAYPLGTELGNATEKWLAAKTSEANAHLAAEAVGGTAGDGPPTRESWDKGLQELAGTDDGGAALALLPTISMFPGLLETCGKGGNWATCAILGDFRATAGRDPAVAAAYAIGAAEQAGDLASVLPAMQAAQSSSLANHPVLGQTYALALLRDQALRRDAEAKGLPANPLQLMLATTDAYPYNPAYWTDLGDLFASSWDYETAMLLYDVALALPMPEALRENAVLRAKADQALRIRTDFPAFYLPQ